MALVKLAWAAFFPQLRRGFWWPLSGGSAEVEVFLQALLNPRRILPGLLSQTVFCLPLLIV